MQQVTSRRLPIRLAEWSEYQWKKEISGCEEYQNWQPIRVIEWGQNNPRFLRERHTGKSGLRAEDNDMRFLPTYLPCQQFDEVNDMWHIWSGEDLISTMLVFKIPVDPSNIISNSLFWQTFTFMMFYDPLNWAIPEMKIVNIFFIMVS